jgi:hypothetical protein
MNVVRIVWTVSLVAFCATTAWGQYGLYGAPQPVPLPPVQPATAPYAHAPPGPLAPPGSYPTTAAPSGAVQGAAYPAYGGAWGASPLPVRAAATTPAPAPDSPALLEPPEPPGPLAPNSLPSEPSAVEQMLSRGAYEYGDGRPAAGGQGCYSEPPGWGGEPACGEACRAFPWFASVSWLTLGRDRANRVWTTYEDGNNPNQLGHTGDAAIGFKSGIEVHLGRRFHCDQWGLEGVYWTLGQTHASAAFAHPSGVSTPLIVRYNEFNGTDARNWFDGAGEHRLSRWNEYHNVELNLIRYRFFPDCGMPWGVDWLVGVRYFRFEERLLFGSLQQGATWGQDGGAREAYLDDRITNSMVGFQFGFNADYALGGGFSLFIAPRLGIYNNHIRHDFGMYLGDGTVATTGSSGVAGAYPVVSHTNRFAFLGQIDVGAEWKFAPRWSLRGGYRLMALTGVGLSDHQIPPYIVDIPELAAIDTNGHLILHGAFCGVTFNY